METARLSNDIFTAGIDKVPTRDGYGDAVTELGEKHPEIVVLSADLTDSTRSSKFKKAFPERFIEVGVAEQNMAGIAAGLALSGKIPFISSYAVFSPGRNWDQIRVSIAYSKANVKIIGAHAGLSVGPDGATHQALEDIALTRVLPNMTVLNPCDYEQTKKAVEKAVEHDGPVYIRLAREKTPVFTTKETPFEIGKAQVFMEGSDITIISSGPILYEAMKAANNLKMEHGISCEVISSPSIKPLDRNTIMKSIDKTRRVLTLDEHQIAGGLGSAIAEMIYQEFPVKMKLMGINDTFGESGEFKELWEKYGISSHHVEINVREMMEE